MDPARTSFLAWLVNMVVLACTWTMAHKYNMVDGYHELGDEVRLTKGSGEEESESIFQRKQI